MMFLCMFVLVECVWYKLEWEWILDKDRWIMEINKEWVLFLKVLVEREFFRFDGMGIKYCVFVFGVRYCCL